MANFEDQIGRIKDRVELRTWIDELPDDVEGIIIVKVSEERESRERAFYRYREIGPITMAEANYAVDAYKWFAFKVGEV
jgi:hypothetical protein